MQQVVCSKDSGDNSYPPNSNSPLRESEWACVVAVQSLLRSPSRKNSVFGYKEDCSQCLKLLVPALHTSAFEPRPHSSWAALPVTQQGRGPGLGVSPHGEKPSRKPSVLSRGVRGWPQLSHVHQPQWFFLPHPAHSHPLPFKGVRSTLWSEAFPGPFLPPPILSLMLPTADLLYSELPPSGCLPEDSSDTVECCQKRKKKKKKNVVEALLHDFQDWGIKGQAASLLFTGTLTLGAFSCHIVRKPKPAHVETPHGEAPR